MNPGGFPSCTLPRKKPLKAYQARLLWVEVRPYLPKRFGMTFITDEHHSLTKRR